MCTCMRNRPPLGTILQEKAVEFAEAVSDFASYITSNIPCIAEDDRERYRKHHEDAWVCCLKETNSNQHNKQQNK